MRGTWALGAADFSPLTVILVALVATIGALAIHAFSRRRAGALLVEERVRSRPVSAAPGIELADLAETLRDFAARMGLPERLLPRLAEPSDEDGNFVYRDGEVYVYCTVERGIVSAAYRTPVLDDLLFRIFHDRAWTRAYTGLLGQDLSPEEHAQRLVADQAALLEKAEPRWAQRLLEGV